MSNSFYDVNKYAQQKSLWEPQTCSTSSKLQVMLSVRNYYLSESVINLILQNLALNEINVLAIKCTIFSNVT